MKNKKNLIYIVSFIVLMIIIIILKFPISKEKNKEKDDENNSLSNIKISEESLKTTSKVNEDSLKVLDAIFNIKDIKTAKLDSQIKFLSVKDNTYQDLLSLSFYSNITNKETIKLKGAIDLTITSLDINLNFPMIAENIGNKDFEMFLEIPSSYRESFEMTQEEEYLYVSSENLKKTEELFNLKNFFSENQIEGQVENITSNITYNEIDDKSGIYDINLNSDNISYLYNLIVNDNKYKSNVYFQKMLLLLLKDESNISNISSLTGQVAVYNNYATDIYFEIENNSGSVIAFRLTLNDINNDLITIEDFSTDKTKDFYEFMKTLELEINNKNNKKNISIGNIYFTGKDETIEKNIFKASKLDSVINVFINFSKCSKNTDLVVKWYYENQQVPIVENKLSNGEYEEGILKSSISFTDNIPAGKYKIKIYIDGINEVQGESSFTIK